MQDGQHTNMIFENRIHAGILLAEELKKKNFEDLVVVAIPRGGIPVAAEISQRLNIPLSIVLAKKIGHPSNPEYAIGSVSMHEVVIDTDQNVSKEYLTNKVKEIKETLKVRMSKYEKYYSQINLKNKVVILVDDGIATGNTMLACISIIKKQHLKKIVIAIPVAPSQAISKLKSKVDSIMCLFIAKDFIGIGAFYKDFHQIDDSEVINTLENINLKFR